ncbi:MAG TPA: HDIG domain-containing protein, partial [Thermoplasmatales archaeon]|nr:HDIG domain-containing protein [Thermoplasmatales archaeon]
MTRDEALPLLNKNLRTENLKKHSFAVEAILEDMAKKLGEDSQLWGLTGLLHDLDYDFTKNEPERHSQ